MEKEEVKEVLKEEGNGKKMKALVTSRILFISALDKIYLVVLLLTFIGLTWANFAGDVSDLDYGFWARVGIEIVIIIGMVIYYFILNWFYKCAAKTMICLTKNEVYKEEYVPFKRSETSIPLNKITGVSTFNLFWIFRFLIIHQYGKLPIIFPTWTNQVFKDKLNELITSNKEKVENEFEDKNIIGKEKLKYLKYLGIALVAIIGLIGIVRFFNYVFSDEAKLAGTYTYRDKEITLNKDGSCEAYNVIDEDVEDCSWTYDKEESEVDVRLEYSEYSRYYGYYTDYDYVYFLYDSKTKTLTDNDIVYKK